MSIFFIKKIYILYGCGLLYDLMLIHFIGLDIAYEKKNFPASSKKKLVQPIDTRLVVKITTNLFQKNELLYAHKIQ